MPPQGVQATRIGLWLNKARPVRLLLNYTADRLGKDGRIWRSLESRSMKAVGPYDAAPSSRSPRG